MYFGKFPPLRATAGAFEKIHARGFPGAVFTAFQFWALMLTLEILVGGANLSIWPVIGVMLVSVAGRTACSYWSTNAETETGYFMVAEKRVHIGDRLRYIPMGYFNDNSLGNITAVVTTTLGMWRTTPPAAWSASSAVSSTPWLCVWRSCL